MTDKSWTETWEGVTYTVRHGCPFDRGIADSWYSRKVVPHYYVEDSYGSKKIGQADMTSGQIAEYKAGYAYNESLGGKKDWG
jgi:hypothetical protein